jgi:DNA adenine methylase
MAIDKSAVGEISPPIKWHGGKTYLAARIIALMPAHIHYVEPFFGGGAVFFRKPDNFVAGHSEVINDIYLELVNFWRVLQSETQFIEFERRMNLTPFAKPIWEESLEYVPTEDPIERAGAFFVRYRQSRQGLGNAFATMSRTRTRRGMNEQISSWLSAIEGLPAAHERLKRVVIFNEDASKLIKQEDETTSFFYCDPPYLRATRIAKDAYSFEMTDLQHQELLDTLGNIRGKFLLSGYPNPLYEQAAQKYGWNRVDIEIDNKASSAKVKPKQTECLWFNYAETVKPATNDLDLVLV